MTCVDRRFIAFNVVDRLGERWRPIGSAYGSRPKYRWL